MEACGSHARSLVRSRANSMTMLELSAFTPPMKVTFEGDMARRRTIGGYPDGYEDRRTKSWTLLI